LGATNDVTFGRVTASSITVGGDSAIIFIGDADGQKNVFEFDGTAEQAIARTNLGIPLPALTNTNVGNFIGALGLSGTNATPVEYASALFDTPESLEALRIEDGEWIVSTSSATTNAPDNTNNPVRWIKVLEGTNSYRLPLFQ
jgi:hypothetical protein